MPYKHTQIGTVILVLVASLAILMAVFWFINEQMRWVASLTLVFLLIIALLFGTLTVEVGKGKIRCWFGIGLISRELQLSEISRVEKVRNSWLDGWGIRLTSRGWMFNVSGLEAIEITLTSGKHFRIGTDQPSLLEASIRHEA